MVSRLRRLYRYFFGYGLFQNVNNTAFTKDCLLIYIVLPFLRRPSISHQNQWQARELVRIVGEYGYNVDVIDYWDQRIKLARKYGLIIDVHPGMNRDTRTLTTESSVRIAYTTGSNPSFSNRAEAERLEDLFRRRGVRVRQRRWVKPYSKDVLESHDAMFFIGNAYNLKTFDEFHLKRVYFIRNTGYLILRNVDYSRKSGHNFLFLASSGQVHKGLDLLLEVFARNPHLNLYICSGFDSEEDFCKIYQRELFHSKNIFPIGFLDISSVQFREVSQLCSYAVLPSCAEANAGSILTAMSAGLIPIVSRECGFEEDEVHFFEKCTLECISRTLNAFAEKPMAWIESEAKRILIIVESKYSEKNYTDSVRFALAELLR